MTKTYASKNEIDALAQKGFVFHPTKDHFVRSNMKNETVWKNSNGSWIYLKDTFCSKKFDKFLDLLIYSDEQRV